MSFEIINKNCIEVIDEKSIDEKVDLTFLDPPFNQQKDYALHNDNMDEKEYWEMMKKSCAYSFTITN